MMARWCWVAILVAACDGAPDYGSAPLADYEQRLADARCAAGVRCGRYESDAICRAMSLRALSPIDAAVAGGALAYDPAEGARCLWATEHAACDDDAEVASACAHVTRGLLATGATCRFAGECATGACLLETCTGCCGGTCTPADTTAPARRGEACAVARCEAGSYCAADFVCRAPHGQGEACDARDACTDGLMCAGSPATCQPPPAAGEPCVATTLQCGADNLWCDRTTMTCRQRGFTGDACDPDYDSCADYLPCDPITRTCVGAPIGAPCGRGCAPGGVCIGDVCTAPQANGASCTDRRECASQYCAAGVCADFQACF